MKKRIHVLSFLAVLLVWLMATGNPVYAQERMTDSSYVKLYQGNDGTTLWTVEESLPFTDLYYLHDDSFFPYCYEHGETITTGIPSTLRSLETGEHYYDYNRIGEVPVGYWRVEWHPGRCIHSGGKNNTTEYKGLAMGTGGCANAYYSGRKAIDLFRYYS